MNDSSPTDESLSVFRMRDEGLHSVSDQYIGDRLSEEDDTLVHAIDGIIGALQTTEEFISRSEQLVDYLQSVSLELKSRQQEDARRATWTRRL